MANLFFFRNFKIYLNNFNWSSIWDNQDKAKTSSPLIDLVLNFLSDMKSIKQKENYKNLIIGHLNINSVRNKIEMIAKIIKDFDIFKFNFSKCTI